MIRKSVGVFAAAFFLVVAAIGCAGDRASRRCPVDPPEAYTSCVNAKIAAVRGGITTAAEAAAIAAEIREQWDKEAAPVTD